MPFEESFTYYTRDSWTYDGRYTVQCMQDTKAHLINKIYVVFLWRFVQNWQIYNSCTFTTLSLKNLHHWFVFISNFRTYQVFSGPCISQCIVFNWKASMLISPHFS